MLYSLAHERDDKGIWVPVSLSYIPDHIQILSHEERVTQLGQYHLLYNNFLKENHRKVLDNYFLESMKTKNYYLPLRTLATCILNNTECNIDKPNERLSKALEIAELFTHLSHKEACTMHITLIDYLLNPSDIDKVTALRKVGELFPLAKAHDIDKKNAWTIKSLERKFARQLLPDEDLILETSLGLRP